MKSTFLLTATLCVALSAAIAAPAYADTTPTTTPRQGRVAQRQAAACTRVSARLDLIQARIDNRAQITQTLFEKQDAKFAALATKAQTAGVDVSHLQSDLTTWQGYTTTIHNKRTEILTDVTSAKQSICSGDRAGELTQLQNARGIVTDILNVRLDRLNYYTGTIVPDLKTVRDELRTKKS